MTALIPLVPSPPAFMGFGFQEMLLIAFVALLVFGGNLPDVMRQLGRTYGKFRHSLHELSAPVRDEIRQARALHRPEHRTARYAKATMPEDEEPDPNAPDDEGAEENDPVEPSTEEESLRGGIARGAGLPPEDDEIDEPPPV